VEILEGTTVIETHYDECNGQSLLEYACLGNTYQIVTGLGCDVNEICSFGACTANFELPNAPPNPGDPSGLIIQ
jgi:hypothetical protein